MGCVNKSLESLDEFVRKNMATLTILQICDSIYNVSTGKKKNAQEMDRVSVEFLWSRRMSIDTHSRPCAVKPDSI